MMSWLSNLLGHSSSLPRIPEGVRIYAVGDVHGRDDLLGHLLDTIEKDAAVKGRARNILIFLGDLVDRGPHSANVIERLRHYAPEGFECVFLMGNHEEVLLRVLHGEHDLIGDWLRFGGAELLASYGLDPATIRSRKPSEAIEEIAAAIPPEHVDFIQSFADTYQAGDYVFVHAGLRPGVPLHGQSQHDLRWIRRPFLESDTMTGRVVVHGHTIVEDIEVRANRIAIDTGAYRTGILTAIGIQNDQKWFLQSGK